MIGTELESSESTSNPIATERKLDQNDDKMMQRNSNSPQPSSSSISKSSSQRNSSPTSADLSTSELLETDNAPQSDEHPPSSTPFVHGHTLPSGWTCQYNPNTDQYNFELQTGNVAPPLYPSAITGKSPTRDDTAQTSRRPTLNIYECKYGYHFPTTPTSSMISELAKQVHKSSTKAPTSQTAPKTKQIGYGKNKLTILSDEDKQLKRLNEMFPTATSPVIEQMIRIYHGREGLIKAALISLGYKRASEYKSQQTIAQSPIMLMMSKPTSKKLFDKLVSYFPDKDEDLIKGLMFKHKEVEHEIISALVESSQEEQLAKYTYLQIDKFKTDKNGAIMKLRYLKFLYPTCEEIELYHLLHCHDLNAQKVMEVVEKRGHKRVNLEEVLQNRKTQTQQIRAQQQAHAAKDKPPSGASELLEAHKKRPKPNLTEARLQNLKENLKKTFGNLDDGLLLGALEATDFNESLAKKFLEEMEPIDDAFYKQRYHLTREAKPEVVAFPCKAIQKGETTFMSIVANEHVYIPKEVTECKNALALLKVDASTFTQEDFPRRRSTYCFGRKLGLAFGSSHGEWRKMRKSLCERSNGDIRSGSKYVEICKDQSRSEPNKKAIGCNKKLPSGRSNELVCGRNANLLERTHPFFKPEVCNSKMWPTY